MSGFTKGPWAVEDTREYGADIIICANKNFVAETGSWMSEFKDEQHANAHLISAAPDMYEALKRLIDYVEIEFEGKDMTHGLDCSVINAKNMIAKAEGRTCTDS